MQESFAEQVVVSSDPKDGSEAKQGKNILGLGRGMGVGGNLHLTLQSITLVGEKALLLEIKFTYSKTHKL
jgi:hypothetical protein